jgi:uncharacterized protein
MMQHPIRWILLFVVIILLFSLITFYSIVRPFKELSTRTPKDFHLNYESVQFKTQDNLSIKGWFIPSQRKDAKTIILLHGYPRDKGDILPSRLFLQKNYNLLFIDFRHLGESQGAYSSVGHDEILDLQAALNYLHQRHIDEVGVWGLSLGAAVALMTAPKAPAIKAIVAESSYARLDKMADHYYPIPGLNYIMGKLLRLWALLFLRIDIQSVQPVLGLQSLKIPVLLIYSKSDQVVPIEHGLIMQQAAQQHPNIKIIFVNHLRHGGLMEHYQDTINQFFAKNL